MSIVSHKTGGKRGLLSASTGFTSVAFYHKAAKSPKATKLSPFVILRAFARRISMTEACRVKLSRVRMLSRLFLFCAFMIFAPAAHAACILAPTAVCNGVPCAGNAVKAGRVIYNQDYRLLQICLADGTWKALNKAAPLLDCPNVGDMCASNGTIYAGMYEGHKYYVTAVDAPGTYTWNNGAASGFNLNNTFMPNCPSGAVRNGNRYSDQSNSACMGAQGEAFTAYMATFAGSQSPYRAARYCYHLGKPTDPAGPGNPLAHGRDDWYLPAIDELEFLFDNLGPQPAHGFQYASYWSSTETTANMNAWTQAFSGGSQSVITAKFNTRQVRCVAR